MNCRRSLAAVLFFLVSGVFAQQQVLRQADYYATDRKWKVAIPLYEEYLKKNKRDVRVQLKLAKCYVNTYQDQRAALWLAQYRESTNRLSYDYYLVQGQLLQQQHHFREAIKIYKLGAPKGHISPAVQKKIDECSLGIRLVKKRQQINVVNLGKHVNAKDHDLLPQITANESELYFSSYRSGGKHPMDIYVTKRSDGGWQKATKVMSPISTNNNEACVGLSIDGLLMFVYKGVNGGDLFTSRYDKGHWQTPIAFPFNTSAKESSITITPDGKEMIFVRKAKGKSSQLWYSTLQKDSSWSSPKTFVLDTPYDEETPYFHADGNTLFFSSKGEETMGGYDILMAKRIDGVWQRPQNLGYPLNSAKDEIGFVVNAKGDKAYYSTLKAEGQGGQDLYRVELDPQLISSEMKLVTGVVKSLEGSSLEASLTLIDLETNQEYQVKTNDQGYYLISLKANKQYGIRIEKKGYLFHSDYFETEASYEEQVLDVVLTKEQTPQAIVLTNVFFDSGASTLKSTSSAELDHVVGYLKKNPHVQIKIVGYTDNIGDAKANLILSEKRALAVKKSIVDRGIADNQVAAVGRGEQNPIASNETAKGRAQNRRIEMVVQ